MWVVCRPVWVTKACQLFLVPSRSSNPPLYPSKGCELGSMLRLLIPLLSTWAHIWVPWGVGSASTPFSNASVQWTQRTKHCVLLAMRSIWIKCWCASQGLRPVPCLPMFALINKRHKRTTRHLAWRTIVLNATSTVAGHSTVFLYARWRLGRHRRTAFRNATGTATGHCTVFLYGRFFGTEGERFNTV